MLKLTVAVLAIALVSSAGAAGWKDLRIDGSSEAAFKQSLDVFNEKLSPERRSVFTAALTDIWLLGTQKAQADQRQFTVNDYYQQLHGLSYEEVVTFTDPTGDTAKGRYREATRRNAGSTAPPVTPWRNPAYSAPEESFEGKHETLDHGDLMRTRQGSPTPRGQPGLGGIPGQQ